MIYRTTKCPICHGYVEVLKPEGDILGTPFVICPKCGNIIIDVDKKELALKTKTELYRYLVWVNFVSIVVTTLVVGIISGVILNLLGLSDSAGYTLQSILIGFIVGIIICIIRNRHFPNVIENLPEIKNSINRLKSDEYRYALIRNDFYIKYNCIFDSLEYRNVVNKTLRNRIINDISRRGCFRSYKYTYILRDAGIFDYISIKYSEDKNLKKIKEKSIIDYITVIIAHSLGVGIIIGNEVANIAGIDKFLMSEKINNKVKNIIAENDPYEVATSLAKENLIKDRLEDIVIIATKHIYEDNKINVNSSDIIKDIMRIMYDIGYSYALQYQQ